MTQHNQKQVLSLLSLLKTFTCVSDGSWIRFIRVFYKNKCVVIIFTVLSIKALKM